MIIPFTDIEEAKKNRERLENDRKKEAEVANYSVEEKRLIAIEAQARGLKVVAAEKGIEMRLVRGWVGAYCRKPQDSPPVEKPVRRPYHRKPKVEAGDKGNPELPKVTDWEQECKRISQRFDGYHQAIQDIFGQQHIEVKPKRD